MLQKLIERRRQGSEEGFTLIELMVVVLIIAILLAIAIPSFLGARGKAQDRAAQSNARNALTAEKTYFTDNQTYTVDANALKAIEPSLTYKAAGLVGGNKEVQVLKANVSVGAAITDGIVCVTGKTAAGKFFLVKDVAGGTNAGTYFQKPANEPVQGDCDDSAPANSSSW